MTELEDILPAMVELSQRLLAMGTDDIDKRDTLLSLLSNVSFSLFCTINSPA